MTSDPILTVPLPLVLDDESAWPQVIDAVRRAGAGRALLYSNMVPNPGNSIRHYRHRLGDAANQDPALLGLAPDLRFFDLWSELLEERMAGFAKVGIPVAFWMGQSLGHGGGYNGSTAGVRPPFQTAQTHLGEDVSGVFCPLCPQLRAYLSGALGRIARAKPEFIILDDDFKLTNRLPTMCWCPLHRAEFLRRGLPDLPPAELVKRIMSGEPSPERAVWWGLHEESLIDLGRALGEAVRIVEPTVRFGVCTTRDGWEEVDLPKLIRAMAGPNRPILRTNCAPYYLRDPQGLNGQIEHVRLQRSWVREALPDAEDMCEGDTYPHLTTRCSATLLDAYIQGNLASGAPQILAYGFSYASPLHFEPGYATMLEQNRERYRTIRDLVPVGSVDLGVTIPWCPGTTRRRRLDPGTEHLDRNSPIPHWLCSRLGIPIAYGVATGPVLLAGLQAELVSDSDLDAWAGRGLVLDVIAAGVLLRRGLACGISSAVPTQAPNAERFIGHEFNGPYAGGVVALWSNHATLHHCCVALPGAETLSSFRTAADGAWGPAVLRWEDGRGRRFGILAWDLCASHDEWQLLWSHPRRWQLQRLLGWVGRSPLPASVDAANAHVMVHRTGPGRTVVSVLNGNFDPLKPVLRLDPALGRPPHIRLLGPSAQRHEVVEADWRIDGDAQLLVLPCTLSALGTCLVTLETRQ